MQVRRRSVESGAFSSYLTDMSLRAAWERNAIAWAQWARSPVHDSYWRFHRDQFLALLPPPRQLALDLGCGEGRLSRDLKTRGYRVVGAVSEAPGSSGTVITEGDRVAGHVR